MAGQDSGSRRARARFQSGLLAWLRAPAQPEGLRDMVAVVRDLSLVDEDKLLWRSAESFLKAMLEGTLAPDDEARRLAKRIERRLAANPAAENVDSDLREALFAWVSRRTLPQGGERNSISVHDLPAAGLAKTLAATAELLPLLGGRLIPQRCDDEQVKAWRAAADSLDRSWGGLLRDGLDPCRKSATALVAVALEIGDSICLKFAEGLATAVGCAEDPGWREAAALRAAIASALELARDPQGPNLPSFAARAEESIRRLEQGEVALRASRQQDDAEAGSTGELDRFVAAAKAHCQALAELVDQAPLPAAELRDSLVWFESQTVGNTMAIRGLVVLWREALATGDTVAVVAPSRAALAALRAAIDGLSLGRALHPDVDAFAALRDAHRRSA